MSVGVMAKGRARLGTVALMISIAQPAVIVIWGAGVVVWHFPHHDWRWMEKPLLLIYLTGAASIPLAIAGLLSGPRRWVAVVALALGAVNFVICGIPLLQ
jgi:hypothetical protein